MEATQVINPVKQLFLSNNFELLEESCEEKHLYLSFIKKDFKVEIGFDETDQTFEISLDRPFYGFNDSQVVQNLEEISLVTKDFIKKIEKMIFSDDLLPKLTKEDCELFLKTGSYDGMSSGVIEYQDSLYYIDSITSPYLKEKSREDSKNRVWRHYYVHEMTKKELETVMMSSLSWLRHINLTSLCKDWKSLSLETGDEAEHKKHFDSKYRGHIIPTIKPTMKLTLFY